MHDDDLRAYAHRPWPIAEVVKQAHWTRELSHNPLATFEALAIDDYIKQAQVPLITPTSAAQRDLAQQKQNDYVIHAVGTAAQPMHVLGDFAAKKLGIKRIATVADDFTYGHEGTAGFQSAFEFAGGDAFFLGLALLMAGALIAVPTVPVSAPGLVTVTTSGPETSVSPS